MAQAFGEALASVRRRVNLGCLVFLLPLVASQVMTYWGRTKGMHCVECDRLRLGSISDWWIRFFEIRDTLILVGGFGALGATLIADKRRYAALVFLYALYVLGARPK